LYFLTIAFCSRQNAESTGVTVETEVPDRYGSQIFEEFLIIKLAEEIAERGLGVSGKLKSREYTKGGDIFAHAF
jgi:hypothetical protein